MADQEFRSEWINFSGGRLHLAVWGESSPGPAVLFLPGTGCASQFYEPFLKPLSAEGFRVVGIDYRGHGQSDGPRGRFTIPDLLDDISAALTFCMKSFGDKVGVMGSSMGGILTVFAAAHDDRFACALAHNAPIPAELTRKIPAGRIGLPIMKAAARIAPHRRVHTRSYVQWNKVIEDKQLLRNLMGDPLFVSHYEIKAILSLMTYQPDLDRIKCPFMVLTGEDDEVVPAWSSKATYNRLKAEKEYVALAGAKHMLLLEYIDETMPIAVRWFKNHLS